VIRESCQFSRSLVLQTFLFLLLNSHSFADVPPPPVVLDVGPGGCIPAAEICGDGIDQDCSGGDLLCSTDDQDQDGFSSSVDCDNTNRYIYPGISAGCSAACGEGTKTCQSNGTYSACSCTPLCEATGSGTCYYVDAQSGSDSNPGTFAARWKTYLNLVEYAGGSSKPARWTSLQPGDVVYFMSGVYRDNYDYNGQQRTFSLRTVNGTATDPIVIKSYPGAHPAIWPKVQYTGMRLLQSNYITIEGFEILGAWGAGLAIDESNHIELRNIWIHDTDGIDNNNVAGLYVVRAENLNIHHMLIHDNYDHTNHDTGGIKTTNSRNVVLFRGGGIRIHHSVLFQTPPITAPKTGGCITYKHSASVAGSIFEVDHNVFRNCATPSIGSGTFHTRIHHNLLIDSAPIGIRDFGGVTHNEDIIIENNTIVNGIGLAYGSSTTYGPIGLLTFRDNIVVDNSTRHHNENAMVVIDTYGNDSMYNTVVTNGNLAFSNNCYHNTAGVTMKWSLFAAGAPNFGTLGGLYSFADWKNLGFGYDADSVAVNPQLDSNYSPTNPACSAKGHYAP